MSRALATALLVLSPLWLLELRRGAPELLGLGSFAPDPFLVGVAFAALRGEPTAACLFAAAAGALSDVPQGAPFGLGAARLAILAALLGSLRTQIDAGAWFVRPLAVLGVALASTSIETIVVEASSEGAPVLSLLGHGLLVAVATAATTPLLWPAGEALLGALRGGRRPSQRGA